MSIIGLGARMQRDVRRLIGFGSLNTMDVSVFWNVEVNPGALDPAIEATYSGTVPMSGTWPALVHFVEPVRSGVRQFLEVQAGDAILDFLADVPLPAGAAEFEIAGTDGVRFVQKDAGEELTQFWDTVIEGQRHVRTILVRRKS